MSETTQDLMPVLWTGSFLFNNTVCRKPATSMSQNGGQETTRISFHFMRIRGCPQGLESHGEVTPPCGRVGLPNLWIGRHHTGSGQVALPSCGLRHDETRSSSLWQSADTGSHWESIKELVSPRGTEQPKRLRPLPASGLPTGVWSCPRTCIKTLWRGSVCRDQNHCG